MRLRAGQCAERGDLHLRAHRRRLVHLIHGHPDDLELRVGDDDAVAAGITRRFDDRQGLLSGRVPSLDDERLRGALLQDLAHGR
jgi:hypothetical protein